jgi:hypothetical protein
MDGSIAGDERIVKANDSGVGQLAVRFSAHMQGRTDSVMVALPPTIVLNPAYITHLTLQANLRFAPQLY